MERRRRARLPSIVGGRLTLRQAGPGILPPVSTQLSVVRPDDARIAIAQRLMPSQPPASAAEGLAQPPSG